VITAEPIKHFLSREIRCILLKILKSITKHTPPVIIIDQCVYRRHSSSIKPYAIPPKENRNPSCFIFLIKKPPHLFSPAVILFMLFFCLTV
jgi:hypothetical protein